MQYVVSFLDLQSHAGEERADCFALIVFLLSSDCKFSVSLAYCLSISLKTLADWLNLIFFTLLATYL